MSRLLEAIDAEIAELTDQAVAIDHRIGQLRGLRDQAEHLGPWPGVASDVEAAPASESRPPERPGAPAPSPDSTDGDEIPADAVRQAIRDLTDDDVPATTPRILQHLGIEHRGRQSQAKRRELRERLAWLIQLGRLRVGPTFRRANTYIAVGDDVDDNGQTARSAPASGRPEPQDVRHRKAEGAATRTAAGNGQPEGTLEGRVLSRLMHSPMSVPQLADEFDEKPAVMAGIVQKLKREGEVTRQRDGRFVGKT